MLQTKQRMLWLRISRQNGLQKTKQKQKITRINRRNEDWIKWQNVKHTLSVTYCILVLTPNESYWPYKGGKTTIIGQIVLKIKINKKWGKHTKNVYSKCLLRLALLQFSCCSKCLFLYSPFHLNLTLSPLLATIFLSTSLHFIWTVLKIIICRLTVTHFSAHLAWHGLIGNAYQCIHSFRTRHTNLTSTLWINRASFFIDQWWTISWLPTDFHYVPRHLLVDSYHHLYQQKSSWPSIQVKMAPILTAWLFR